MTFVENLIDQGITYKTQGVKGQCNVMIPIIGGQEYHFLEVFTTKVFYVILKKYGS